MKKFSAVLTAEAPKATKDAGAQMKNFQAQLFRAQTAVWSNRHRVVIAFEGFDAAGKGTCIRHLTEKMDPRNVRVIPVGAPRETEKGQHFLQRFWKELPGLGQTVIFDRSWYGRVLVEKVEKLAPKERLKQAYEEIKQFEQTLKDDGIILIKIFLVVSKHEQLKRFEDRLEDPMKMWKITEEDVRNRKRWDDYVEAADLAVKKCSGWVLIRSDDKDHARLESIKAVLAALKHLRVPPKEKKGKLVKELLES
jgi:AMP-polyphosphate phosphotransferase